MIRVRPLEDCNIASTSSMASIVVPSITLSNFWAGSNTSEAFEVDVESDRADMTIAPKAEFVIDGGIGCSSEASRAMDGDLTSGTKRVPAGLSIVQAFEANALNECLGVCFVANRAKCLAPADIILRTEKN